MVQQTTITAPPTRFTDDQGRLTREAYRFLLSLTQNSNTAVAGEIATPSGSGLQGGGAVANGVTLSIQPDGVTNAMLRNSMAVSVMGRAFNSAGNPADIVADANNRVLSREGNQLAFRAFINGVSIGPTIAAPVVRFDALATTITPSASTATVAETIPITTPSGIRYVLLSTTP